MAKENHPIFQLKHHEYRMFTCRFFAFTILCPSLPVENLQKTTSEPTAPWQGARPVSDSRPSPLAVETSRLGVLTHPLRRHTFFFPTKSHGFWTLNLGKGLYWLTINYCVFSMSWKQLHIFPLTQNKTKRLNPRSTQRCGHFGFPPLPPERWDGARFVNIQKEMEEQLKYTKLI